MPEKTKVAKKCLIGYKDGTTRGLFYGSVFSSLDSCCQKFEVYFLQTGNAKNSNFNSISKIGSNPKQGGMSLVKYGGEFKVMLTVSEPLRETEINFCPFCGAEIEIKCVATVRLKERFRQEFDGYDEE